ncbi:MAG: hypothetical protein FJ319_10040 [SAR202 cluster bacterium]|nr:hypothetical protein [SAR202 cluster bacterium]
MILKVPSVPVRDIALKEEILMRTFPKPVALLLVVASLYFPFAGTALAGPGDLDVTFGSGGLATTEFAYSGVIESLALQSDGKIVAAGVEFTSNSNGNFALARYNVGGSLDTTFGNGGVATTTFGGQRATAWSVKVYQSGPNAGKILAAGDNQVTVGGVVQFALARYNPDGTLDTTFDGDGKVITGFANQGDIGAQSQAFSVAIQSDGKIVAAGAFFKFFATAWDIALARYNPDGSLDASFDGDGKVITDIGGFDLGMGDVADAVVVLPDGKILVAGHAAVSSQNSTDFALVRYNSDGSLDGTFGSGGMVTTDFGTALDNAYEMAVQTDGKIVLAGHAGDFPTADFAVARYLPDGALDTSFDGDGKVTTNLGGWDNGKSVAIQTDGAIDVVGYTNVGSTGFNFAVARYSTDGSLDPSFGIGGKVFTDFVGGPDSANAVVVQPDSRIVAGGSGGTDDFALARYGEASEPPPGPSVPSTGAVGLIAIAAGMAGAAWLAGVRRKRRQAGRRASPEHPRSWK